MKQYLESSAYIDWTHPDVAGKAHELAAGGTLEEEIAKRCFEFVRDAIKHSWDYRMNPVTGRASDVLRSGTGYCFAKSHLLAALLRANGIPAGLCYQRLSIDDKGPPYSLHGFNAVYLERIGWYRVDARGNKPGIDAAFSPPVEKLAFTPSLPGEKDFAEICREPLPCVIQALTRNKTIDELQAHLPDAEAIG